MRVLATAAASPVQSASSCRASGLPKHKRTSSQSKSDNKQTDISAYFRDTFAFQKRYLRTYVHPFNGPFSGTTRVSRDQKGTTNLDFTEARDSEAIRALKPFPETVFVDGYLITMLIFYFAGFCSARDAENGVDNTVEENSSVFSLIRMHWLPSAKACRQ